MSVCLPSQRTGVPPFPLCLLQLIIGLACTVPMVILLQGKDLQVEYWPFHQYLQTNKIFSTNFHEEFNFQLVEYRWIINILWEYFKQQYYCAAVPVDALGVLPAAALDPLLGAARQEEENGWYSVYLVNSTDSIVKIWAALENWNRTLGAGQGLALHLGVQVELRPVEWERKCVVLQGSVSWRGFWRGIYPCCWGDRPAPFIHICTTKLQV